MTGRQCVKKTPMAGKGTKVQSAMKQNKRFKQTRTRRGKNK